MSLFTQSTWSKTVRGLGVTALAGSLAASALMVPAQAAPADSTARCTTRCFEVSAKETQGLPGQYQMAQSKSTGSLWVTGTAGRLGETATLARVNPDSLKIEATAALPTVRQGTGQRAGYKYNGAFGIDVDDVHGTVWVTNTRTNAVSVFDQKTLKQVWTSFGTDIVRSTRDVRVDTASGKAFVTDGAGVVAVDLKNFAATRLDLGANAGIGMNPYLDSAAGKLYIPDLGQNVLNVIDTASNKVERRMALKKDDAAVALNASDVTVDHSLKEIYVSSQGDRAGKNSGITVYDLETGAFKKSIPIGAQALAVSNDEDRDLVYVTDFSGAVAVLDAKTGKVVSTVKTGRSTTDVFVAQDGSVFALDKAGKYGNTTVPFTLDYASGATRTFNAEQNGYGAQLTPISADSLFRIDVKTSATGSSDAPVPSVDPAHVAFQGYPAPVSTYQGSLSDVSFTDVDKSNPFYSDIQWVANKGVAEGWPDGTYRSLENIDRGAMAAYLYRLAGSPQFDAPATSQFKDVPTTHQFYKEISWLQASGIATGWSDGTYRPDQAVNRDAMAAFFYRAAGSPVYNGDHAQQFADVKKSDQFAKEISWARDHGITKGWEDNTYRPVQPIARDAMAAFVHRFAAKYQVVASAQ